MSQTAFNDRISRITGKTTYASSDFTSGDGVATLRFSSPLQQAETVRKFHKVILMGLVLGLIAGVLVSGSVNPDALWGPGTQYHGYVAMPSAIALISSPFLAILGCVLRSRVPALFYMTAAYLPAVVAAALY